jgi:hypothetical protein
VDLQLGKNNNPLFFMSPVYKPEFFEFAAIVTDGDDVSLKLSGERFICNTFWLACNELEECEDLLVVALV